MILRKNHVKQKRLILLNGILFFLISIISIIIVIGIDNLNLLLGLILISLLVSIAYIFSNTYLFYKVKYMKYIMPCEILRDYNLDKDFYRIFSEIMTKQGYETHIKKFGKILSYKSTDNLYIDILDENRKSILRCKCFRDKIDRGQIENFSRAMINSGYIGTVLVVLATDNISKEDIVFIESKNMEIWSDKKLKLEIDKAFNLEVSQ